MARIRSIFPGLFTDEAFMSASMPARLLIIGVWGECWDDGVFEWKPLTLKAKLFAADNVDVGALLAELETLNFVRRFEHGGRQYGVVRNFCRYQRPRKPNQSGVRPAEFGTYVGSSGDGPEPDDPEPPPKAEPPAVEVGAVPYQYRTGTGKSPQMEDGEGEGRGIRTNGSSSKVDSSFHDLDVRSFVRSFVADWPAAEIAVLALEFPAVDVPGVLPELVEWAAGKGIRDPSEMKSAVYGALKGRQAKTALSKALLDIGKPKTAGAAADDPNRAVVSDRLVQALAKRRRA